MRSVEQTGTGVWGNTAMATLPASLVMVQHGGVPDLVDVTNR
jgi:hypothetical protein